MEYHSALTDHVPAFISEPGQTDYLMVAVSVLLVVAILAIGNLYFQLHAIPERVAHRTNKVQMEIVAILALISLFTHNHLYWILGLLLAFIRIPDFSTPLYSIARSLAKLSGRGQVTPRDDVVVDARDAEQVQPPTATKEKAAEGSAPSAGFAPQRVALQTIPGKEGI